MTALAVSCVPGKITSTFAKPVASDDDLRNIVAYIKAQEG